MSLSRGTMETTKAALVLVLLHLRREHDGASIGERLETAICDLTTLLEVLNDIKTPRTPTIYGKGPQTHDAMDRHAGDSQSGEQRAELAGADSLEWHGEFREGASQDDYSDDDSAVGSVRGDGDEHS